MFLKKIGVGLLAGRFTSWFALAGLPTGVWKGRWRRRFDRHFTSKRRDSRFGQTSENACSQQLTTALGIEEQTDPLGPNLHGIAPVSLASAESLVSIQ